MIIDEKEFFRQVTIRICDVLDMDMAMCRCLQYFDDVVGNGEGVRTCFSGWEYKSDTA
jgi:hypothetical protein